MSQTPESSQQRHTPIPVELTPSKTKTPSSSENETGVKTGEEAQTSAGPKPFLIVKTSEVVLEKSFKDVQLSKDVSSQTSAERLSNVHQQTSFRSLQTKDSNLSNAKTRDLTTPSAIDKKQADRVSLRSSPSCDQPPQRLDPKNAKYKVKQAQGYGYQQGGYPQQYPPQQGYAQHPPPQPAYQPQPGYYGGYGQPPPPPPRQQESGGCWKKVCCLGSCAACCMLLCASCLGAAMDDESNENLDVGD